MAASAKKLLVFNIEARFNSAKMIYGQSKKKKLEKLDDNIDHELKQQWQQSRDNWTRQSENGDRNKPQFLDFVKSW